MVLTITGIVYILYNKGNVNAGYAVIPMVFTIISLTLYRQKNKPV